MSKKRYDISIDENIMKKAKKQIPNISGFIETCLKKYLGLEKTLVPSHKMHELVQSISKYQLELHLLSEQGNLEEQKEQIKKDEINYTWRLLFTEYRDTKKINQEKLNQASKVLGVSNDELIDIIEVLFVFQHEDNIDVTDWESVYNRYGGGK